MPELFSESARDPGLAAHFSRASRLAVAGLILPPAVLSAASMLGRPMRSGVEALAWISAIAGFAATGWLAGRRLAHRPVVPLQIAAAFAAGGAVVTPAFRSLQGLSGREPVLAVVGGTVAAFAIAFGLMGAATALVAGVPRARVRGAVRTSVLGGIAGGLLALVPYGWALVGLTGPLAGYAQMATAVIAILGCIIVPCRLIGSAVTTAMTGTVPGTVSGDHR
jgi:hypothetical protein